MGQGARGPAARPPSCPPPRAHCSPRLCRGEHCSLKMSHQIKELKTVPRAVPAMSIAWPLAPERASPWVLSRLWGSQVQPPAWVLQAACDGRQREGRILPSAPGLG